jgi:murein DD-endopeptidase MepM/ murein hydrolase activator NlpD
MTHEFDRSTWYRFRRDGPGEINRLLSGPRRRSGVAAAVVALVMSLALAPSPSAVACWLPPVSGSVVDPYRQPACAWCLGHRGIDYSVAVGATVRAVASGTVSYSGVVAGTRYVVVDIGRGRRVTYGRLMSVRVRRGDRVLARTAIGTASRTLYFGLRVHGVYTDPTPLIGRLVGRPRLVPRDGSAPRPAPPATVRCARRW